MSQRNDLLSNVFKVTSPSSALMMQQCQQLLSRCGRRHRLLMALSHGAAPLCSGTAASPGRTRPGRTKLHPRTFLACVAEVGEAAVVIQKEDGERLSLITAPKKIGVWVTFEDADRSPFPFHAAFCYSSWPIAVPQPWLLLGCF